MNYNSITKNNTKKAIYGLFLITNLHYNVYNKYIIVYLIDHQSK